MTPAGSVHASIATFTRVGTGAVHTTVLAIQINDAPAAVALLKVIEFQCRYF